MIAAEHGGGGRPIVPRRMPPYGPVIKYLRESHHQSQAQLGLRIGEADYYVGYLENGFRWPRPQQLERLARAFSWEVFELALVADVEIPYPDWPRLDDLPGWRKLARDWAGIVDAVARYTLARELHAHPDWQQILDPTLADLVRQYGLVACYDWIRRRWVPERPHAARLEPVHSLEQFREALDPPLAGPEVIREPAFLEGLTAADRAAVEAVARSLKAQRARS